MSAGASLGYDLFIAHAGPDLAHAERLFDLLAPGLTLFLDSRSIEPGQAWDRIIPLAQRSSRATVVLVSPTIDMALYLHDEIATGIALQRAYPGAHRVIPVYLDGLPADPMEVPYGLRGLQALDARREGGLEGVAARLRAVVAGWRDVPSETASGHRIPIGKDPVPTAREERHAGGNAYLQDDESHSGMPLDLIDVLCQAYPDVGDARALWERAGGKAGDVENISRPRDLWQRLVLHSLRGGAVRPAALIRAALEDLPANAVILKYRDLWAGRAPMDTSGDLHDKAAD